MHSHVYITPLAHTLHRSEGVSLMGDSVPGCVDMEHGLLGIVISVNPPTQMFDDRYLDKGLPRVPEVITPSISAGLYT